MRGVGGGDKSFSELGKARISLLLIFKIIKGIYRGNDAGVREAGIFPLPLPFLRGGVIKMLRWCRS